MKKLKRIALRLDVEMMEAIRYEQEKRSVNLSSIIMWIIRATYALMPYIKVVLCLLIACSITTNITKTTINIGICVRTNIQADCMNSENANGIVKAKIERMAVEYFACVTENAK